MRLSSTAKWIGLLLLAGSAGLLLDQDPGAWAAPLAAPHRQTVPLTPPATWTPVSPSSTPRQTAAPPGSPPTDQESPPPPAAPPSVETPGTPAATLVGTAPALTSTLALSPTSLTPAAVSVETPVQPFSSGAEPRLALTADPLVVGPRSEVALRLGVRNTGKGSLEGVTVTLTEPSALRFNSVRVYGGDLRWEESQLTWDPGQLPAGAEGILEIAAVVGDDVLPDTTIPLVATLSWPSGEDVTQELVMRLPWALLPETGE